MADEEEKKAEEQQPADSDKEGESKTGPEKKEKAPTVDDIEDILKEVMAEEPAEPEAKAPETAEAPPEIAIDVPKSEPPVIEDKPEKKEEIVAKPEEKIEEGEEPKEVPSEEPVGGKEAPKVAEAPEAPEEERAEEAPKVEEPKPVQKPEAPMEVTEEKPEEPKAETEEKPPKEKKEKDEKSKKVDRKEVSEKEPEPEKPAPRRAKKSQTEEPGMIISPLIFGKFDLREVEVTDPGLRKYINLSPVGIPHTGARHANRWLGKTKINIVERLINNLMRTEHSTGKKSFSYKAVNNAFEIIAKRTKQNPIQVLVDALQNASPKEEITRLRFGGISVPKAVDTSSSRRLDIALRNLCKGAVSSSHRNRKRMEMCLADEIILAAKGDMNSFAISKKEETERIAASAR